MRQPTKQLYEFGPFRLDPVERLLYRDSEVVPLTAKVFDILLVFVQNSGRTLEKEEMMREVWPDQFVEEGNLTRNVSTLRKALGESQENHRYIVTIPGRGYRFVAEAREIAVENGDSNSQAAAAARASEAVGDSPGMTGIAHTHAGSGNKGHIALALRISVPVLIALATAAVVYALFIREKRPAPRPAITSIAVLPLENLSKDPEQEYFADGMTDEIITDLAKLPGLRVISRTSTAQYKGARRPLRQIAHELNVDGVVEGTVLRVGDRVRIRAQLIYAPLDKYLWAEAYERDAKDILTLQATLARDIASEVRLKLTPQQEAHVVAAHSVAPEAHELYLKGRYFWNKRNEESLSKAVEYFQKAIVKDPNYAAAYAGLADAYSLGGGHPASEAEVMVKAKAAADMALKLDHDLPEAEASLGLITLFLDWNWAAAQQHFERAIALDPNYATAHHWYAEAYLIPMGKMDAAIVEARKAQELDPLSPVIATDLGKELYFGRRYDEAEVEFRRALELDPNFISAHNWLSDTFLEKGMYSQAARELEKTRAFKEERTYLRQKAYLLARMGRRSEAERALEKSLQLSQRKHVSSGAVALVYAMLGKKDKSFSWLEKACAEKSSFMTSLRYWPAFDGMRADPRFASLLRNVGLPE
jgi:TolB-like protein/DNA-binding winged helix-turn-helix (wHTH) protein/Tfp pilus assembly protein PilF